MRILNPFAKPLSCELTVITACSGIGQNCTYLAARMLPFAIHVSCYSRNLKARMLISSTPRAWQVDPESAPGVL